MISVAKITFTYKKAMRTAIIVTGLPASGKSTVARQIASALSWKIFDKDDFLENLYEVRGVISWDERKKLSRESDVLFQQKAELAKSPVLVSHWRPTNGSHDSGTPTDWLERSFEKIIEVNCVCTPQTATRRFLERQRHPGHLDQERDASELAESMQELSVAYPLNIGIVVDVNTENNIDFSILIERIRRHLGCSPQK